MNPRVAILDDDRRMAEVLSMVLRRDGYELRVWNDPRTFLEDLAHERFDVLLTDLKMPGLDGVQVLSRAKEIDAGMPVILVTAHATVKTAIDAMKKGAFDYVQKPFDNDAVRKVVRRALALTALERENRYLRAELRARYRLDNLIAVAEPMVEVIDLAQRAARGRATVLITGESGTGKEVIARAIHYYSDRVGKPFVAINCKALAAGVLESELFGHEKGAFTGADRARPGLFEQADGGTLFLDEIGEVDLGFQAKLLRVLQERQVRRVGADRERPVDVRVIAATNRDLSADVADEKFREDLFYRIAVIPMHLPPLRERRGDVLPLARHFLERFNSDMGREIGGWSDDVERYLTSHDWPGNVRELENAIERAVVLCRDDELAIEDVRMGVGPRVAGSTDPDDPSLTLNDYLDVKAAERIRQVLAATGGVRVDAAKQLGVERTTLYRLMRKFGIEG